MNAQNTPSPLTLAAISNPEILRAIADHELMSPGDVADAAGVPPKNIARTLQRLKDDGVILDPKGNPYALTATGKRVLQALNLADGQETAGETAEPNDVLLLRHDQLRANPMNARRLDLDDPQQRLELDSLKSQIVAADDVLQNLTVSPADAGGIHTLLAGERRWTAVGELIAEGLWPADRPLRAVPRAPNPGQAAFISLVENSQVPLTTIERARGYFALVADTGWSGREAALRTGWDVKSVQQYLQVLREADPAHIAAHEAGDPNWKWEDLRKSVQEPKTVVTPAQGDVVEAAARSWRSTYWREREGVKLVGPGGNDPHDWFNPRQRLIIAELADACIARPLSLVVLGEDGWTDIRSIPDRAADDDLAGLISTGCISFRQHPTLAFDYVKVWFSAGSAREDGGVHGLLSRWGFYRDRGGLLNLLRAQAGVIEPIFPAHSTEWLNPPWGNALREEAASPAQANKATTESRAGDWSAPMRGALKVFAFSEISLTVEKSYALAEVNHKQGAGDYAAFGSSAAKITPFARHNLEFKSLVTHGFLAWGRDHEGHDYAKLTGHGEAWLERSQYPTGFAHGKYRTAWLNDHAAEPGPSHFGGGASLGKPPAPPKAADGPDAALSPVERITMMEMAHKLLTAPDGQDSAGEPIVNAPKYWLDQTASDLRGRGFVEFVHSPNRPPIGGMLKAGRAWVAHRFATITDADLLSARGDLESYEVGEDGYVTPWLNTPAAGEAAAEVEPPTPRGEVDDAEGGEGLSGDLKDEAEDDQLVETLKDAVQVTLSRSVGDDGRWNRPSVSSKDLAEEVWASLRMGYAVDAIIAIAALIEREGETAAEAAIRAKIPKPPPAADALVSIRVGDIVHKGTTSTAYRILERLDDGDHQGGGRSCPRFRAQTIRNGKDYGKPVVINFTDVFGLVDEVRS